MYAQFMERQRANRPETFFRKLNKQAKELYLLKVKFLCDDTKQHNTIVFLMQSSMTSFIASFKMLQDTEHYVIFLPYVLLHVLVAYFFARCFDGCLISIH